MSKPDWVQPIPKQGRKPSPARVSLSAWRASILQRDGGRCRACGYRGPSVATDDRFQFPHLSAHHLIFRSHCQKVYVDDPRNGLTLCNELGNGCHPKLHSGKLKIKRSWLPADVIACLEEQGLVFTQDGPVGTLARYFQGE